MLKHPRKVYSSDHPILSEIFNDLAYAYLEKKNIIKASDLCEKSKKLIKKILTMVISN